MRMPARVVIVVFPRIWGAEGPKASTALPIHCRPIGYGEELGSRLGVGKLKQLTSRSDVWTRTS